MPVTLAQARGFVVSYSVTYVPTSKRRNVVSIPGNQSSLLITGLEMMMEYSVTLMAHTSAGHSDGTTLVLQS